LAASAFDRAQEARDLLATAGIVQMTPTGLRAHPAVKIEEQARLGFARLLRELDLDLEPPVATSRPAPLRSLR
jgi:hypothetical protein